MHARRLCCCKVVARSTLLLCAKHRAGVFVSSSNVLACRLIFPRSEHSCCHARTIYPAVLPILAVPSRDGEHCSRRRTLQRLLSAERNSGGAHAGRGAEQFVKRRVLVFRKDPTNTSSRCWEVLGFRVLLLMYTIQLGGDRGGTPNPPLAGRSLRAGRPERLHSPLSPCLGRWSAGGRHEGPRKPQQSRNNQHTDQAAAAGAAAPPAQHHVASSLPIRQDASLARRAFRKGHGVRSRPALLAYRTMAAHELKRCERDNKRFCAR